MTDLEMTKLCAQAMGFEIDKVWPDTTRVFVEYPWRCFEPLTDDAQALALVRRFHIDLSWSDTSVWDAAWFHDDYMGEWANEQLQARGTHSDLNRAIVECVAKMQATVGDIKKAEKP